MKKWLLLTLMLIPGIAVGQVTMYSTQGPMEQVKSDGSGNQLFKDAGAAGPTTGLTFQPFTALGPTSFRERVDWNGITGPNNTFYYDSSQVISTYGATKIALYFYTVPDSGANFGDSLLTTTHWFAVSLRANVTASNDSGSAATIMGHRGYTSASGFTCDWLNALGDTNVAFVQNTTLRPGEFLVGLKPAGNGLSGWRYFSFTDKDFAGGIPDRFSFTMRTMGHTLGGSGSGGLARNNRFRTLVRVDVRGYR